MAGPVLLRLGKAGVIRGTDSKEVRFCDHQDAVSNILDEVKVPMQFGMIEMDGGLGLIGKVTVILIFCILIAFIYHAVAMLIRLKLLYRRVHLICQPLLTQIEEGKWEPAGLSWPDMKSQKFTEIIDALKKELSSQRPLSMIATIKQGLDLLSGPINRMIYHLKVLGWGACLIGYLGAVFEMRAIFRDMFIREPPSIVPASFNISEAFLLQGLGLAVGIACLAVSSFSHSRLKFLYQDLSNRILIASAKKAD